MSTNEQIYDAFLSPMTALYRKPYGTDDEAATLAYYTKYLSRFTVEELEAGFDSLVENRKETAKDWPAIGEVMAACGRGRGELKVKSGTRRVNKFGFDFEDERRRQKLANDLLNTDQARDWFREGIAEYVWGHFYQTEAYPTEQDIGRFRGKRAEQLEWEAKFVETSAFNQHQVESFAVGRIKREQRALSGGQYRPIDGGDFVPTGAI